MTETPKEQADYCCDEAKEIALIVSDEGIFIIDGCCGGCYAAYDIKFCPFCGTTLTVK